MDKAKFKWTVVWYDGYGDSHEYCLTDDEVTERLQTIQNHFDVKPIDVLIYPVSTEMTGEEWLKKEGPTHK